MACIIVFYCVKAFYLTVSQRGAFLSFSSSHFASLTGDTLFLICFRKGRGEAKKCRKVYGVERKDQWCTACRWKKACQRFPD